MAYKLYTDKSEVFECDIKLSGASIKDSFARLIVESDDMSFVFDGTISKGGKCSIPVKKLKGFLDESSSGNIKLEVVADDTYFIPWKSEFLVESSKKVTVEVKSQQKEVIKENGPTISVSGIKNSNTISKSDRKHIINIMRLLIKENIDIENLKVKRGKLNTIIAEYTRKNNIEKTGNVIDGIVKVLKKRK
jgi:hypothetical protein